MTATPTDPPQRFRPLLSVALAGAIVLAWCITALLLDQPIWMSQRSRLLLEIAAANGELGAHSQWWRLVTSQFLHVHGLHMLFNAACVALIGGALERRHGPATVALVAMVGGTLGQLASVLAYPQLVSSGASQALMALCAAALVLPAGRAGRSLALAVVAIQAGLDLYVAHTIKAGHGFGFLAGAVVALALALAGRRRGTPQARLG